LAARTAGARDFDPQIFRFQLNVDIFRLRQHCHGCCRRMNTALSLGGRHALHAVHTALVPKLAKDRFARHAKDRFLKSTKLRRTGFEVLSLQSRRFCIAVVHPVKIGGEDSGFVAACPGTDFYDRVALFRFICR
jgi:hypothetical protein